MVTIEEFLQMFRSKDTRIGYKTSLKQFFEVVGIPLSEYFNNGRRYENDVIAFLNYMENEGMKPKSIQCKLGAVRSYLVENEVDLPRRFWKRLKINGQAVTKDRLFTKQELRMIFDHMDLVARAIAFVQLSTALRIGDVLQIKRSDLHLTDKYPARFYYMNHKIRRYCVAFLTEEGRKTIEEWLKVREEWIMKYIWFNAVHKGLTDLGFEEFCEEKKLDNLLFPIRKSSVYRRWWVALDSAGLNERDPTTNRRVFHTQTFRQYMKSWCGKELKPQVVECLLGHTGGLNNIETVYNRYGSDCEESLAQDFLKVEHLLSLNGDEVQSRNKIENLIETIEKQQKIIDEMINRDLDKEWERKFVLNRKHFQ